jgi:hypothetical protein
MMGIFIEKKSDLHREESSLLLDLGYRYVVNDLTGELYYYDPKHWKLTSVGQVYDFSYGGFHLKSQTIEAKELAIMDGYGKCKILISI